MAVNLGLFGRGFADDIIILAVRWYVRYRLSYTEVREVSEWLAERGILVDQSTIYRWVQRFLPLFGKVARKYRDRVGPDWRVDETYARIRGRWHYIYRTIDGCGQIIDAYVSPTRDMVAVRRFLERAIASSGTRRGGSSPTRRAPTRQRWPPWYRAFCIELVVIARMVSNVITVS